MIVVGMIGLLASIAGVRYERFVRKARQAEAKLALAATYSLQKSFFAEYSAYIPAFDAIGYTPEGSRRFYRVLAAAGADHDTGWSGAVKGYTNVPTTFWYPELNSPYPYNFTGPGGCVYPNIAEIGNDPDTFHSVALATLCPGCRTDIWVMDNNKRLTNCSIGL